MFSEKVKETAWKYALQNAVQFNGKANAKAVAGKVIAALKKDGVSPREVVPIVNSVVEQVNRLSLSRQISELTEVAPELLHREKKERVFSLPPLPQAEKGRVVTRFPPEPNGYLHIGHAKAAIIDSEYAKLYDGRFILRFDDTNPENARFEFYEAQREDLRWLGVEWDEEYNTSDHLDIHYKLAEQLIEQGNAYVCSCPPDVVKEGRFYSKPCPCKKKTPGESLDLWKELLLSQEKAILRLHGDMKSSNTAMRDPTLFRVIEAEHPLQGDKYHVWPTYDFAGAVEDSISGVTHPFRTKEYELRDPVYFQILSLLNLRKPYLMEFSRLAIKGMPVSKRKIKPLIDKGLVSGYDDVRLPTLRGLRRRGILPETIKQFVFSQGISKAEATVDFSIVEAINRKILDSKAKRYFFVPDPIKLVVEDAPRRITRLRLHPSLDVGERTIETKSIFFIQKKDAEGMKKGDIFRLKGLYNVEITEVADEIRGKYHGEELVADMTKVQWTTDDHIEIRVFVAGPVFKKGRYNPQSLLELRGYAEKAVSDVEHGETVQFERVGFVRLEKKDREILGFFAHK
jgi:glutamyl-tRNA synthetase